MIERKLSKTQSRVFMALAAQKQELQQAFQEVVTAEQEQIEMLRAKYDLPEGDYQLRQEQDGTVVMFAMPEEAEEAEEAEEGDGEG